MPDLEADLRAAVKDCLARACLSQAHVARQLGISAKHVSWMLTGKAQLSIAWAGRIAEVCGRELRITSVRRRRPALDRQEPPQ